MRLKTYLSYIVCGWIGLILQFLRYSWGYKYRAIINLFAMFVVRIEVIDELLSKWIIVV